MPKDKEIKKVSDTLPEYYNKQTAKSKEELKWSLINAMLMATDSNRVNTCKFLLENMFDWKNGGAITTELKKDKINVLFVEAKNKDKK